MLKYLKLSNFLLVFLVLVLIYLAFSKIFIQEGENRGLEKQETENVSTSPGADNSPSSQPSSQSKDSQEELKTPQPKIGKIEEAPKEVVEERAQTERTNGFYKNSTYDYQVKFPKEWPLRVRSKEVVSLGYAIPKEGRGAVTIEVSEEAEVEVEEAKKEAQKYPGIINISEKTVFIDDILGTKYILEEKMSGEKNIYILLNNLGRSYLLKYPEQAEDIDSDLFLPEVDYVLNNFKFLSD